MCKEVDEFSSISLDLLAKINPIGEKFKWYENGKLKSGSDYLTKIKSVFGISDQNGVIQCEFCDLSNAIADYDAKKTGSEENLIAKMKKFYPTMTPGSNYLAVGPDFSSVGDPENYKFRDCSEIHKESSLFQDRKKNAQHEMTYLSDSEGFSEMTVIFPPAGLQPMASKCFFDDSNGWTLIKSWKKSQKSLDLAKILSSGNKGFEMGLGSPDGWFYIGTKWLSYLATIPSHLEKNSMQIIMKNGAKKETYLLDDFEVLI